MALDAGTRLGPSDLRSRLGPSDLRSRLGGGGMGEVYRATDTLTS